MDSDRDDGGCDLFRGKTVWLPQMRVGYLYLFGEHEEAHGVSRKADGFRSRSVRHQWSGSLANTLVEATDGGEGKEGGAATLEVA